MRRIAEPALNCAVNSYGQVRDFFVHNPCRSLDRTPFPLLSTRAFRRLLDLATEAGYGDLDFSAIGRLYQDSDPETLRWCTTTAESLRGPNTAA